MSDEKVSKSSELEELPELPDHEGPHGLQAHEHVPELPDDALHHDDPEPSRDPTASTTPTAPTANGGKPPLRELDKAPTHLRKAAVIASVGCLLPFMAADGSWISAIVAKALALAGVWFWLQQVNHNWGPKLTGFLGKLGELDLVKKAKDDEAEKTRRARASAQAKPAYLAHPFPTGLHVLSLVTILVACVGLPLLDSGEAYKPFAAMAEIGMLTWAAYTWVHIHAYERWGTFNPLFPLMFLAMLIGGIARVVFGLGGELSGLMKLSSMVGGGIVAIGGGLAAYTIVEALMQAKKEGDIKKQAQIEARREARKARRSGDAS